MSSPPLVLYRVDAADRLQWFNDGWLAFAATNGGERMAPSNIRGHVLWEFIGDATTVSLYQRMLLRVRQGGTPMRFQFRCDAPDSHRLLMMEISSADDAGAIQFAVTSVAEEAHLAIPLLDPDRPAGMTVLSQCAWCTRIDVGADVWREVEEAVTTLNLFRFSPLPRLTHGICADCAQSIDTALDELPEGREPMFTVGEFRPR